MAARALSGLDMFSGDFAELVAGDAAFIPGSRPPDVRRNVKPTCQCLRKRKKAVSAELVAGDAAFAPSSSPRT